MEDEDLLPIAILIDELRHECVANRLNSIQKLNVIGRALGPARTREELLPYLGGVCLYFDSVRIGLSVAMHRLTLFSSVSPMYMHTCTRTNIHIHTYTRVHNLSEFIDDEDEVLLALCAELPKLIDVLGGVEHAGLLLQPLESLAGVEESTVREKVCRSKEFPDKVLHAGVRGQWKWQHWNGRHL
jgi:serine/threonine-protein phosphatase 2A regulatory subunit A